MDLTSAVSPASSQLRDPAAGLQPHAYAWESASHFGHLAQPLELVRVADGVDLGDPGVLDDERHGRVVLAAGVDARCDGAVEVDDERRGAGRELGEAGH